MTAKLISFLFLGILLTLGYDLFIGLIYARFFPTASFFQDDWYVPLVAAPALLLGTLAWSLGFYRPGGQRGWDIAVTAVIAAIVALTIPASYSCGTGCF